MPAPSTAASVTTASERTKEARPAHLQRPRACISAPDAAIARAWIALHSRAAADVKPMPNEAPSSKHSRAASSLSHSLAASHSRAANAKSVRRRSLSHSLAASHSLTGCRCAGNVAAAARCRLAVTSCRCTHELHMRSQCSRVCLSPRTHGLAMRSQCSGSLSHSLVASRARPACGAHGRRHARRQPRRASAEQGQPAQDHDELRRRGLQPCGRPPPAWVRTCQVPMCDTAAPDYSQIHHCPPAPGTSLSKLSGAHAVRLQISHASAG